MNWMKWGNLNALKLLIHIGYIGYSEEHVSKVISIVLACLRLGSGNEVWRSIESLENGFGGTRGSWNEASGQSFGL